MQPNSAPDIYLMKREKSRAGCMTVLFATLVVFAIGAVGAFLHWRHARTSEPTEPSSVETPESPPSVDPEIPPVQMPDLPVPAPAPPLPQPLAPPPPPLASYDLPAFSSTTNDPEPHFVKMTISLGYEFNADISSEITQRVPQMQHIINVILRGKSYEELDSVEDTLSLSEEIKGNLNSIFSSGKIKEIYFKEFIVN